MEPPLLIMLELNDVLLKGEKSTLSLMAAEGQLTCIVGPVRWLHAMMGFEPVLAGYISIDGEPLTPQLAATMRRSMAFVPATMADVGEVCVYEAPSADDVLALRANRACKNADLQQETKLTGGRGAQARMLATAVLLGRPMLLVEQPQPAMLPYLRRQAAAGKVVIVTSTDSSIIAGADNVVETAR